MAVDPERFLAVYVVLATGGAAIFINYLILRSPSQKGDKMPRILEFGRRGPHAAEEAPPDTLEEIERVEARPEQPGQLTAHHQADLGLVALQKLARGSFVT